MTKSPKATRDTVVNKYKSRRGIVTAVGPFHGKPIYVPYFWQQGEDGWFDRLYVTGKGEPAWVFVVDEDERRAFPELGRRREISIVAFEDGTIGEG